MRLPIFKNILARVVASAIMQTHSILCPFVLGRASAQEENYFRYQIETSSGTVDFIGYKGFRNQRPRIVLISTEVGSIAKFDFDEDGIWDQVVTEGDGIKITVRDPSDGQFEKLEIQKIEGGRLVTLKFALSKDGLAYDLWQLRHQSIPTFFASTEPECENDSDKQKSENLKKAAEDIEATAEADKPEFAKLVDKSCSDIQSKKIKLSYAKINLSSNTIKPKYFACMAGLSPRYKEFARVGQSQYLQLIAGKNNGGVTFTCAEELKQPGKNAQIDAKRMVTVRSSWLNPISNGNEIDKVVFHELIHAAGIEDEKEIERLVGCCALEDATKCGLKNSEAPEVGTPKSPPIYRPQGGTRPSNAHVAEESRRGDRVTGEKQTNNSFDPAGSQMAVVVAPLPKDRRTFEHQAAKSPGVISGAIQEGRKAFEKVEPAMRISRALSIPRAEASISSQRLDADSKVNESISITPSSVETKVVGMNANGSPKLQLPDGSTVQSFRAFGAVAIMKYSNETVGSQGDSNSFAKAASVSAPSAQSAAAAASASSGPALTAAPRLTSPQAGSSHAEAKAASTGGGGGSGSGSSSFGGGGSSGVQAAAPRAASVRAPSSQEATQVASSTLEYRSHGTEYLKQVKVEKTGDMMNMITGASQPRELLRQPWFVEHLKAEQFRVQVIDRGQKYGSDRPKVLWNLPVLLKENQR